MGGMDRPATLRIKICNDHRVETTREGGKKSVGMGGGERTKLSRRRERVITGCFRRCTRPGHGVSLDVGNVDERIVLKNGLPKIPKSQKGKFKNARAPKNLKIQKGKVCFFPRFKLPNDKFPFLDLPHFTTTLALPRAHQWRSNQPLALARVTRPAAIPPTPLSALSRGRFPCGRSPPTARPHQNLPA